MDHIRYPRHFLLLGCFCASLAVMSRLNLPGSLSAAFATYGTLHAAALAAALRARQPLWRLCLFVVSAALLCVITFRAALLGRSLFDAAPGIAASYSTLGLVAAIGAIAYGVLIRSCGLYALTVRALAGISICCMAAAVVALNIATHSRILGPWWVAACWWYGFSCGLWYFDRRHADARSVTGR